MQHDTPTVLAFTETADVATLHDNSATDFRLVGQSADNDAFRATLVPDEKLYFESPLTDAVPNKAPERAAADVPEIRCHQREGDWMSAVALDRSVRRRAWLFAGAFVGGFCLGWVGASTSSRFIEVSAALPASEKKLANNLGSEKTAGIERSERNHAEKPSVDILSTSASVSAAIASDSSTFKPSPVARLAPTPLPPVSRIAQDNIPSLSGAAKSDERRLTPTPQTRPATIEGWTVRQVHGGTAVLEGPGGIWRAARGDSVPGLGRIDSVVLWGGRWIVATTKGLVTTQ